MEIDKKILNLINKKNKKLLVVTKYLDKKNTEEILKKTKNENCFLGLGENRIENIIEKNLNRNLIHFIGNIQSKNIKKIVKNCCCIHSVFKLKHIEKISKQVKIFNLKNINIFIQIKVDNQKLNGLKINEIENFLVHTKKFSNINILGFMIIGKSKFSKKEKIIEFKKILNLKKYNSKFLINMGTSIDFEIGLEMGVDIVRIGKKLYF